MWPFNVKLTDAPFYRAYRTHESSDGTITFGHVNALRSMHHVGSFLGGLIHGQLFLLGWRLLCFSFLLPLFFLLLFLGEISLAFSERIIGFGHRQSSLVGFRVKVGY